MSSIFVATQPLFRAFPASIHNDVSFVLERMPSEGSVHTVAIGPVSIRGESLTIPSRIYHDEPGSVSVSAVQTRHKVILDCIYSRHHNGFVREKHLRSLIHSTEFFVPPFVVQLLGEYVIEMQQFLAEHIDRFKEEPYATFVAENPAFMELTRKRIISYWDCYYRRVTRNYRDFVGYKVWTVLTAKQ